MAGTVKLHCGMHCVIYRKFSLHSRVADYADSIHTAVTSQARGLPPFRGTSVRPSGRLPSDRTKPAVP